MTGLSDLQPGAIFASDFQIERPLAKGGMGAVYVVRQLSTGRARALKLMHPLLASDESLRKRFEQEARVGSHIKSSHVVEVIAAGVDVPTGMPWLAMELLEGEDLAQHVERLGPRPLGEVAAILSQLCHALSAAHDVGVVHRDLKPENVFLARSLQQGAPTLVKLLDLGIAKIVAEASPRNTAAVGTPLWMAPEQMGGSVGPQADVWALGLLAFWMLTGTHYWRAAASLSEGSLMGVLKEMASDPLEPASVRAATLGVGVALPAGFDNWFACAVAREPQQRFANARAAHQAFLHVESGVAHTLVGPAFLAEANSARLSAGSGPTPAGVATTVVTPATAPNAAQPSRPAGRAGWGAALALVAVAGAVALAASQRGAPVVASAPKVVSAVASAPVAPPSTSASVPTAPQRQSADLSDDKLVWKVPLGDSPIRGQANAPVTIVELANYQCPYTRGVEPGLAKLLQEFDGKVRLVWKDDPLAVHSQAEMAASLAREARAQQGDAGYWAAHDAMLAPDFKPSAASLRAVAKTLGLDLARLERAFSERSYADVISRDAELADDLLAVGTPYFFVNGRRTVTTSSLENVRAVIAEELAKVDTWAKQGVAPGAIYDKLLEQGHGPQPLEIRPYSTGTVTGPTRGAQKADVLMVELCDYKSFLCKLVDPMVDELLQKFPEQLGMTWAEPEHFLGDDSRRAAIAARASYRVAGVDGFDRMRRLLFENQAQGFAQPILGAYAKALRFDTVGFTSYLTDPELFGELELDAAHARDASIKDVPTFLICTTDYCKNGGYVLRGGQPRRAFEKRVRLAAAAKGGLLSASP